MLKFLKQFIPSQLKQWFWKKDLQKMLKTDRQTRPNIQESQTLKRLRKMPQNDFVKYVKESYYDYQANKHLDKSKTPANCKCRGGILYGGFGGVFNGKAVYYDHADLNCSVIPQFRTK
jgi:hypothetical protein